MKSILSVIGFLAASVISVGPPNHPPALLRPRVNRPPHDPCEGGPVPVSLEDLNGRRHVVAEEGAYVAHVNLQRRSTLAEVFRAFGLDPEEHEIFCDHTIFGNDELLCRVFPIAPLASHVLLFYRPLALYCT